MLGPQLKELPSHSKILLLCFLFFLLAGYVVAVLQVYEHTGFDVEHIVLEYRGSDNPDLMAFPKPFAEILQNTHAHIMVVPLIYFVLSVIFFSSSASERLKTILVVSLFVGFGLEISSLWLLRYVHEGFVNLGLVGNGLAGGAYLWMCARCVADLLQKRH